MKEMLIQIIGCLLTALLLIIESTSDIKRKEINLKLLAVFFVAGIVLFLMSSKHNWLLFVGGIAEGAALLLVSYATREGIGLGDGFLLICTGALLGAKNNLIMFFVACFLCSIWSAILIFFKKAGRKTRIPFVPFLIPGFIVMCLAGL